MRNKKFVAVGVVIGVLVLVGIVSFLLLRSQQSEPTVVVQVGSKNIYESDVERLMFTYPRNDDTDATELRALATDRLVEDSIILQAAQDQGLIDYSDEDLQTLHTFAEPRQKVIGEIKQKVIESTERIEGEIVSIWFYNNYMAGPLGYEGSKERAREIIESYHSAVVDGSQSIEEVGDAIRANEELAELDAAYKENASWDFSINPGERASKIPELDEELWALEEGAPSDIYTFEAGHENVPVAYFFGVVKERHDGLYNNYDTWLQEQKEKYAVN